MKLSEEIAKPEFLANLGKSYLANERDLIQRCIEYRGHDIAIEEPCFEGMDEWIIIKQEEGGEAWEKMNPESFLYSIPKELILNILCEDFISVFDVLVCVGFNSLNRYEMLDVTQSAKTFIIELAKGNLKPREPSTKEIWMPEMNLLACIGFPKVYPDLWWVLSFEEAEAWAVKSFATSLKALLKRICEELDGYTESATDAESQEPPSGQQALASAPQMPLELEAEKKGFHDPYLEDKPIHPQKKKSYLGVIAALLDMNNSKPSKRGLPKTIKMTLEQKGINLSEDAISTVMKEVEAYLSSQ